MVILWLSRKIFLFLEDVLKYLRQSVMMFPTYTHLVYKHAYNESEYGKNLIIV